MKENKKLTTTGLFVWLSLITLTVYGIIELFINYLKQ